MNTLFFLSDGKTVRERLLDMRAAGNKEFSVKLHPGVDNVLGLRLPQLRKLAAEIAKGDWERYLSAPGDLYMEERMLHGMVLGCIPVNDFENYLNLVAQFVPTVNSWSVCDSFNFAGGRKFIAKNDREIFTWLQQWLKSDREYEVRFGIVMLMQYYVREEYLDELKQLLGAVGHTGYYVSMALAWAISVIIVKFPDEGIAWLKTRPTDKVTVGRAIQKCIDSYRVSAENKEILRKFRREL